MRHADRSEQHKAPCGRTRRGDRQGLSPPSPIKANCLNLNQKKCKFLYDQDKHKFRACQRSLPKEVPQPMLTLMQHNTNGLPHPFSTLEALLAEPFPRTPQDMMQLEQQLSTAAVQTADQIMLVQVTRAHEDEAFVRQAMAQARAQRAVPLVHKGLPTTSVLLLGGTRLILETPYLREDRRERRGRRRGKRGARGTGWYPVLECLGIADRVSPASRSEIALHRVQAA